MNLFLIFYLLHVERPHLASHALLGRHMRHARHILSRQPALLLLFDLLVVNVEVLWTVHVFLTVCRKLGKILIFRMNLVEIGLLVELHNLLHLL